MFMLRSSLLSMHPERRADDVDLAVARDGLWVAFSTAELSQEKVSLARAEDKTQSDIIPLLETEGHSFRPALAPLGEGVLLLGCALLEGRYRPVGLSMQPGRPPQRFSLTARGDVFQVALAAEPGAERAFAAWEEREGPKSIIRVGRLSSEGQLEELALPPSPDTWRRSPALLAARGTAFLAWVEGRKGQGGQVRVARLGDTASPLLVDPHPAPQEAPALALLPDGGLLVAWHSSARGEREVDVTRWIRVALLPPGESRFQDLSPTPEHIPDQKAAGVDQAWEFPSLAVTPDGVIWLAGRSSNGYHVAVRSIREGWSERLSLSEDFWGGRGRRLALRYAPSRGVIFARREPDGVALSLLEVAAQAEEQAMSDGQRAIGEVQGRGQEAAGWRGENQNVSPERISKERSGRTLSPSSMARSPFPVLFGDLHQHTAHSDGVGSVEELFLLARDQRKLDFSAVTDHDLFCRRAIGPATWKYLCTTSEAFYEPGRFVTFPAYEFTGLRYPGPGHKCVYFGDRYPERVPPKDVEAIFAVLREYGGIAVPHHVGWTGADMEHHDPALQPVWEVCSVHGCYHCLGAETAFPPRGDPNLPGQFVEDALLAGLRFGLIGSTDSHGLLWHHGISPKRDPFSAGLAAVFGAEPTRASILDAIRNRRTYATTGARIYLRVELDGAPMGSELPAGTRGTLRVSVVGTAPLSRVVLVRPRGETPLEGIEENRLEASFSLVPDPERAWEYVYVQVEQKNGEMAWGSPIWIG